MPPTLGVAHTSESDPQMASVEASSLGQHLDYKKGDDPQLSREATLDASSTLASNDVENTSHKEAGTPESPVKKEERQESASDKVGGYCRTTECSNRIVESGPRKVDSDKSALSPLGPNSSERNNCDPVETKKNSKKGKKGKNAKVKRVVTGLWDSGETFLRTFLRGSSRTSSKVKVDEIQDKGGPSYIARFTVKLFESEWRTKRYPSPRDTRNIRQRFNQVPLLRSLLVHSGREQGTTEIRYRIRWADTEGLSWSGIFTPKGLADIEVLKIVVERERDHIPPFQTVLVGLRCLDCIITTSSKCKVLDQHQKLSCNCIRIQMKPVEESRNLAKSNQWKYESDDIRIVDILRSHVSGEGMLQVFVKASNEPAKKCVEKKKKVNHEPRMQVAKTAKKVQQGARVSFVDNIKSMELNGGEREEPVVIQTAEYAGLKNQGATCYMNALIQVWYHLYAFRHLTLNLPLPEKASFQLVQPRSDLPVGGVKTSTMRRRPGSDQTTFQTRDQADASRIGNALRVIFSSMDSASLRKASGVKAWSISTSPLTLAFGWDSDEIHHQHDVQELSRFLLDKMETVTERFKTIGRSPKAVGTGIDGMDANKLFKGKLKSYVKCTSVPYESVKSEDFLDLQLNVQGCRSIYDSLAQYTKEEDLTGENQFDASDAGYGKQDAKKGILFQTLPPVLNIHLKRFQYDMTKVHDRLEFPLVLDMSNFVDGANTVQQESGEKKENVPISQSIIYHLHSIIMHRGSASSGHFFSYIRPKRESYPPNSKMENHSDTSAAERNNGQVTTAIKNNNERSHWFLCDDETVMPAAEGSMLQAAYGSNKRRAADSDDASTGSKSSSAGQALKQSTSAYMLIYIRESDLEWVLMPVKQADRANMGVDQQNHLHPSREGQNAGAEIARME